MPTAHASHPAMADINVTPLVDVMLVLLIIFMITLPVVTQTTPLTLPQASPTPKTPPTPPVRIALQADGSITWNTSAISEAGLQAELRGQASLPESARSPLSIAADGELRYEHVLRLLARIHDLGLRDVRLEQR